MAIDKKTELLGINHSTAQSALRKQIIYHLAEKLGMLNCYRCSEHIELNRFSIEHKDSWMGASDPLATFFDMENIAFSHLSPCNVGAANRTGDRLGARREFCQDGHRIEENLETTGRKRRCRLCHNRSRPTSRL